MWLFTAGFILGAVVGAAALFLFALAGTLNHGSEKDWRK
jgi:hypothetical protein